MSGVRRSCDTEQQELLLQTPATARASRPSALIERASRSSSSVAATRVGREARREVARRRCGRWRQVASVSGLVSPPAEPRRRRAPRAAGRRPRRAGTSPAPVPIGRHGVAAEHEHGLERRLPRHGRPRPTPGCPGCRSTERPVGQLVELLAGEGHVRRAGGRPSVGARVAAVVEHDQADVLEVEGVATLTAAPSASSGCAPTSRVVRAHVEDGGGGLGLGQQVALGRAGPRSAGSARASRARRGPARRPPCPGWRG